MACRHSVQGCARLVDTTLFYEASCVTSTIGPLSGSFPILSLRTNKADVVVGVDQEVADRLDASKVESERRWRVNGK